MAEIKSTLDLVMERTKNLRFNDEEKQHLRTETIQKRVNGLVQRYLDQILSAEQVQRAVRELRDELQLEDSEVLRQAFVDKIDLATLEGPLPGLLKILFGCDTAVLENLATSYRTERESLSQQHLQLVKANLEQRYGIAGTAVLPNLNADAEWQRTDRNLAAKVQDQLDRIKRKI
jgi:hypothetical protein